ncbi:luciferase [Dictyobacter alpinus]|uniref:Luciferase n=1 Tax=Dictyobacter alpinus TaxID=2014873 RepID=A0A402BF74_9CHLR|nr:LLM class flavin-dependent oxidoreductase [Dictyobacter alpinus]GCE29989.1 luciferase [Dictyobacter alpinus]
MRFSLFYNFDILPGKSVPELYREIEAQAVAADALGFDAIWLAEHHFDLYGRMPDPLLYLARISAITRQIGLGTAIIEAPHYNPLRLAEDAGLLDILSNGRLRLGVGSGGANKPVEFAHFRIPIEQKSARTLEVIEILRQAFDTGRIDFEGEYYQYKGVEIQPRPVQNARQLLWLAAGNGTPEVAGELGCHLLVPRVGPVSRHQQIIRRYQETLGRKSGFVSVLRFVYAAETEREAQEQTRRTITRYAKYDCGIDWNGHTDTQEYLDLLNRLHAVIGTPDQIIGRLQQWQQEMPFEEVMCQLYAAGMQHEDSLRSLRLLGSEVLPRLQA